MNDQNLSDLIAMVRKFCDDRHWAQFHGPKELAIGLTTESAELLDLFRFKSNEECLLLLKKKGSRRQVEEELADILYFLLRFAQLHEIDLPEAFRKKMAKNRKKYPTRLVKGKNKKYSEYKR